MRKVLAVVMNAPHFLATCNECNWEYADHTDPEEGYREIRMHVYKTGHTVHLEKSVHTNYRLESTNG